MMSEAQYERSIVAVALSAGASVLLLLAPLVSGQPVEVQDVIPRLTWISPPTMPRVLVGSALVILPTIIALLPVVPGLQRVWVLRVATLLMLGIVAYTVLYLGLLFAPALAAMLYAVFGRKGTRNA